MTGNGAGEDPTKPVITNETGELEISTSYEESDLLEGLKAQDEKDGDLTDQIMVGNFSQFIEPGVCNLSYVVFDSSNQAATLTRRVKFYRLSVAGIFPLKPTCICGEQGG